MDDGSDRVCLSATVDFIVSPSDEDNDTISMFRYSAKPRCKAEHHSELSLHRDEWTQRVASGDLLAKHKATYDTLFGLWERQFDTKNASNGILGQTLNGIDSRRQTTQEDRDITEKSSSQWTRSRIDLPAAIKAAHQRGDELVPTRLALNTAALAFAMDAALSFIPLTYSHRFLWDAEACSSLDFALRFMVDRPSLEDFVYQEVRLWAGRCIGLG
jgi:hypothetical protein